MKLKKMLSCGLILGIGIASSIHLLASCRINEKYKPNTIYTVKNHATATTSATLSESEYKKLFYTALKTYLNVDTNKLPKDAVFHITVEDRKTMNEAFAEALTLYEELFNAKKMSEEEYKRLTAQIDSHKNDTYDTIRCFLSLTSSDTSSYDQSNENNYIVTFNSETKEPLFLKAPLSDEGFKILADETPVKISINDLEAKYADLIRTHKIGGIQTPHCITQSISNINKKGDIPVLIYQDQNDANKKVTIAVDSSNGNIDYIYVW